MTTSKKGSSTLKMVELAILSAIIIVFQLSGTAIKLVAFGGTNISLVLIPIVLGAALLGPKAGAWLGFVFGAVTYFMGVTGADYFTFVLFTDHPFLTAVVCFGKAVLAGLLAGLVYKAMHVKHPYLAIFTSAGLAPIVNTGFFILGALTMSDTLSANFVSEGSTVIYFLIIGCAGINFIFEFVLNMIAAPALHRIVTAVSKRLKI